jgi:hypothetical protein
MTVEILDEVPGFIAPGVTEIRILTTIADIHNPTALEAATGTDVSAQVTGGSGWTVTANDVPKPNLKSLFIGNIPGRTTAAESSLTFDQDIDGADVRALFTRGESVYAVFAWGGFGADKFVDIYPVRIKSISPDVKFDETPMSITVGYSIWSEPAQFVAWPV